MAETDPTQFHRGQGGCCWDLPMGPGGSDASVAAAVISENPSNTDLQVWGRWAHEIGHGLQEGGPAHPSNYNNEFELMDYNYPGQTGVFEKQAHTAFPGWLPVTKYQTFTPSCAVGPAPCTGVGGGVAFLWAMEYNPAGRPNDQAVKAYITDNLYYLVSVRRRVFGDELNGKFQGGLAGTNGIPDEGVLIERVEEEADPWVTVKGKNADRNVLWHAGDLYNNAVDGISINILQKVDDNNYQIYVTYSPGAALQADVGLNPWHSPPGNAPETTDIWIDSPVNGYGTYRYGNWDDGTGNQVPRGNGDDPAIGQVNRFYARVRNFGGASAVNVVVHFWINDPPGMAMSGENGFIELGSVSSAKFPALGNIVAGGFTDVYLEWTPDFAVSDADMAAGRFNFHTCVRVKLDAVAGETVLGNQDGDREQENIMYFEVPPAASGAPYSSVIYLRNPNLLSKKYFYLSYKSNLPAGWQLKINNGNMGLELNAGELRLIPIQIIPAAAQPLGSIYAVDVFASSWRNLVNDLKPQDIHLLLEPLGSMRVEAHILKPTAVSCQARSSTPQSAQVNIQGNLIGAEGYINTSAPLKVMVEGVDGNRHFVSSTLKLLTVNLDGSFSGFITRGTQAGTIRDVICLFAGTTALTQSAAGYVPILDRAFFVPLILKK